MRGIIFLIIAYLLAQSSVHHNAAEAGGLEQALDFFSPVTRRWMAGGLMVFGLLSFVEARFRRIHRPPPVGHVAEQMKQHIGA